MKVSVKFEFDHSYGLREIYIHIVNPPIKEIIIMSDSMNTYRLIDYTSDAKGFTDVDDLKDGKHTLIAHLFKRKMIALE